MKWEINYVAGHRIVQVKYSGRMTWNDKRMLGLETLAAGRKKNVRAFLVNQKKTSFGLTVPEINRLPVILKEIGFDAADKVSILIKAGTIEKKLLGFLQNILSLSPMQIRVFIDQQKATDWLLKKPLSKVNPMFN